MFAVLCLSLKLQLLKVFIKSSSSELLDLSYAFDAFGGVTKVPFYFIFFFLSFEYFLLPVISLVDFVCWIPLFLLHFISGCLNRKPEM